MKPTYGEWKRATDQPADEMLVQVVTCFGGFISKPMTGAEMKAKTQDALSGYRQVTVPNGDLRSECRACDGEGMTGHGGNCEAADQGDSYETCKACDGIGFTLTPELERAAGVAFLPSKPSDEEPRKSLNVRLSNDAP